jgi:hypothetical protein
MLSPAPLLVQDLAEQVVAVIEYCIDGLRGVEEFQDRTTIKTISRTDGWENIHVFSKLEQLNCVSRVEFVSKLVAETFPALDENDHDDRRTTKRSIFPEDHLDYQRFQLVNRILLPLLVALGQCYAFLDRLPDPEPHQQSVSKTKPLPPIGMLSLRNYTDIACFVELTVCSSVLPLVEPNILVTVEERARYFLPRSLAGRIQRKSLLWASRCRQGNETYIHMDNHHQDQTELMKTSQVLGSLLLLDRFKPMLLPRHVSDLYAALLQAEAMQNNAQLGCHPNETCLSRTFSPIYSRLLLPRKNSDGTRNETTLLDPILRAKAYQSLLMHGTKAPVWLRKKVSHLLSDLASCQLTSILQVFVHAAPASDRSSAGMRLARALVSGGQKSDEHYIESLCCQVLSILEAVYKEYASLGAMMQSLSRHHEATVHAVWAILVVVPTSTRDHYLLRRTSQNMAGGNETLGTANMIDMVAHYGTLLASIPPCMDTSMICRLVLLPLDYDGQPQEGLAPTTLGVILRLAAISTVLKSNVKNDAILLLELFQKTFLATRFRQSDGVESVSGRDVFGASLVYALAPCQWDLAQLRFRCTSGENDDEAVDVEKMSGGEISLVEFITKEMENRAKVVLNSLFSVGADYADAKTCNLSAIVLARLLQMYFTSDDTRVQVAVPTLFRSPHFQLVPLVCVPVLCEGTRALSLFSSDDDESDCIFEVMGIVFHSTVKRFTDNDDDSSVVPTIGSRFSSKIDRAAAFLSTLVYNGVPSGSYLVDPDIIDGNEEVVVSLASALLSILIGVLELGARRRPRRDEEIFWSFIPLLRPLAELPMVEKAEENVASSTLLEMAEMASHAIALLASRNALDTKEDVPINQEKGLSSHEERITKAEVDLESSDPPIRARGVVLLRHLAMTLTSETASCGTGVDPQGENVPMVKRLLTVSFKALRDKESYVYLAAVHTIVAIADILPKTVLPLLGSALASGVFSPTNPPDLRLSSEQRIKLAESLIFSIRRRGTINEHIPFLMEVMLFGPREASIVRAGPDEVFLMQRQTNEYFLEGRSADESTTPDDEDVNKNWVDINLRVRAGGPLFLNEEKDAVRASRLNVASELVASCDPTIAARFASSVIDASIDALYLATSRPVRRAGAYLAKQLYSALIREDASVNLPCIEIPLAISVIAGDEDILHSALKRCCKELDLNDAGTGLRNVDPATVARCEEALCIRKRASGILAAGKIAFDARRKQSNNPVTRLLEKNNAKVDTSLVRRFVIDEME